jgi:hypothetical protein
VLPDGWTIERVTSVAQGHAEMVSTEVPVILDEFEPGVEQLRKVGTSPLPPRCILKFVDLYLVQDDDNGCWYMGMARPDGVIHCWAGYGDDLGEAIKGL